MNKPEQQASNQSIKDHVWGLSYIDEAVQTRINTNPTGTGGAASWSSYWLMQDANYNVLGVVNSSGVLTERYEYTAYGQRQVFSSAGTNDPGCYAPLTISQRVVTNRAAEILAVKTKRTNQLKGTTMRKINWIAVLTAILLSAILTSHASAMYNPTLGRFMQEDPLGYVQGANRLVYCLDNPIGYVDPKGTDRWAGTKLFHQGIAVDNWICNGKGEYIAAGQFTYDFGVDKEAWKTHMTYTLGLAVILPVFYEKGTVGKENDFHLTGANKHIKSKPCEDMYLISLLDKEVDHPPAYNLFFHNCQHWTWDFAYEGIGLDCSCGCKEAFTRNQKELWGTDNYVPRYNPEYNEGGDLDDPVIKIWTLDPKTGEKTWKEISPGLKALAF